MKTWLKAAVAAAILAAALPAASAFAEEQERDDEGIQAYSVARLKVFKGTVWVRTSDSGEWEEYSTNSPIPERARVSVPDGAEAEIQFHGGQGMLLAAGSEIDVRQLAGERSSFRLRSGEIRFDLPQSDFAPVRVLIPGGGSLAFPGPGRYWVTAQDDGDTRLVVRVGQATVKTDRGESTVRAGEQATIGAEVRIGRFEGGAASPESAPPLYDSEREAGVPPSAAYELRDYGEWVESDEYGYVWRPRVAVGWSPYYYGRWDWISPFGWTWVSFEPWGWYPYHFGYWFADPFFGWCWSPYRSFVSVGFTFGSFRTNHFLGRSVFAPAPVRFIRDGRNVRWVPLRPGERAGRVAFARSDARLAGWDRPLARGSVFVRQGGEGSRIWRDYGAVRGERRPIVRDSTVRPGRGTAQEFRGGRELRRGGETFGGRERAPMPDRPAGRDGALEPRGRETAPRPGRMDRDAPRPRRDRDSRMERRFDGGGGAGRASRPPEGTPRSFERGADRGSGFGAPAPHWSRGAPSTSGAYRFAEPPVSRGDRGRDADRGGRLSLPGTSWGGWGGSDRGGGRDAFGVGPRGGGDWGGGRGGR